MPELTTDWTEAPNDLVRPRQALLRVAAARFRLVLDPGRKPDRPVRVVPLR